ncbi:MAG TPA: hypothetical protein VIH40_07910 [Xanthobacteraceae bacterium]
MQSTIKIAFLAALGVAMVSATASAKTKPQAKQGYGAQATVSAGTQGTPSIILNGRYLATDPDWQVRSMIERDVGVHEGDAY